MKIRDGFISNSSSSSFLVAVKGKLTKQRLIEAMNVPENSPLFFFVKEVASTIFNGLDDTKEFNTIEEFFEYKKDWYDWDEFLDRYEEEVELLNKGYIIKYGWFYSDDETTGAWLYCNGIKIDSDGLMVDGDR